VEDGKLSTVNEEGTSTLKHTMLGRCSRKQGKEPSEGGAHKEHEEECEEEHDEECEEEHEEECEEEHEEECEEEHEEECGRSNEEECEEEHEEECEEEHEESEEHEECQWGGALQLQRRGVSTHEEQSVAGSLQYNCREDEWGVSTVGCTKEKQYR